MICLIPTFFKLEVIMYPLLQNCLVRGSGDEYFLQNYIREINYDLEELHARILWQCNGSKTVEELAKEFNQPVADVLSFLEVLKQAGLLVFQTEFSFTGFPVLAKHPPLLEVQLEITSRCNLWCKHCYGRREFANMTRDEVSFDELSNLIIQMEQMNVSRCFLSGGEVFVRKDVPKIIDFIVARRIPIGGIFTNGTIWRQDIIDALETTKIKPTFLVSMDGATAQVNDYIRGDGVFKKVVDFIKRVKQLGYRITINTIVMKPNIKQLPKMYDFMRELGVDRWRLSIPREQGEAIINEELIIPKWEEIFEVYEALLRKGLENLNEPKLQLSSIFKTEFLLDKKYFLFGKNTGCCEYKRYSLVLKPNGDVVACPAAGAIPFGNIRNATLEEIWYSDRSQAFKTLPVEATECNDCEIKQYCGGGCRMIAWQLHKSLLAKDDNSCPLYWFFCERIQPLFEEYKIKAIQLPDSPEYNYDPMLVTVK